VGSKGEGRQLGNRRRAGSKNLRGFVGRRNGGDSAQVAIPGVASSMLPARSGQAETGCCVNIVKGVIEV